MKELVTELNIKTPFKNNKYGKKWLLLFLQRLPEISRRIPQPSRSSSAEERLKLWFGGINQYIKDNNFKYDVPDLKRVLNADETAFYLSLQGGKVLSLTGGENMYLVGNDEKECLTVLFTANAAGKFPLHMIIFQYERGRDSFKTFKSFLEEYC
ncbi:hypothetical protein PR048_030847 [Dryococelus australis]|uniref:Transposase n=1 Tax=Dryococelus australis TaxID=614101 RepID=A0ABQ9GA13_9NEOP|nr:hypothetical protein PR048_030847 [Dryococelus australis]